MPYTRVHRLLQIVMLLQGRERLAPKDLAARCGVSARNIYRDLNELKAAGIPVKHDRVWGGYRLAGAFFMPPIHLSVEEALALAALATDLAANEQIPFLGAAARALHKVVACLPEGVGRELAARSRELAIRTGPSMERDGFNELYQRVQTALGEGRVLRCRYDPQGDARRSGEEFEFRPAALFFSVRAWYAIGRRSDRRDLRCLKLSRFAKLDLSDKRYEPPTDFSIDEYLGNAWRMIRGDTDIDVELHFDAAFTPNIVETRWHRTQKIDEQPDGSCVLRCAVSGFEEIVWWILGYGPHCRVVKPKALAERVATLARETADQYATAPSRSLRSSAAPEIDERAGASSPRRRTHGRADQAPHQLIGSVTEARTPRPGAARRNSARRDRS